MCRNSFFKRKCYIYVYIIPLCIRTHIHDIFAKVALLEEIKGEGKEEKKDSE
jgi:hypothetical protein